MPLYQAWFIDHRDEVFAAQPFSAENDQAAREYGSRVLKTGFGRGYEIREGERLVYREIY